MAGDRAGVTLRARVVILIAALATLLTAFAPGAERVAAQGDPEQELADRYAPIMMLKAQERPCDDEGEPYEPMSVDIVLDNRLVVMRQMGPQDPVLLQAPGAADVFGLGESIFLDFPGSALNPGCIYEQDFRRFSDGRRAVVYAHVATQADQPGRLALQYWFFWYYNDWNNKHEGDWEGIQLLFDVGTVEEALQTEPVSVGYAQHEGGERADWDDDKLERQGSRPLVYSSAGSHASYYEEALFLGRSGSEGFGCDNTDGPSRSLDPEVVVLPDAVDDPDDPLAWLAFEGRWGERQSGPFNGPTGPLLKERWTEPIEWHDELRSRSVVVPGGEGAAQSVILAFCDVVEFGSQQLITLNENPAILVIAVLLISAVITFLLGRTDWTRVDPLPIVARRRAGQLIRASTRLFRQHAGRWLMVGFAYFPITVIAGALLQLTRVIPFMDALLEAESDVGFVGVGLTVIIGAGAHFFGLTVVVAGVAFLMRDIERGDDLDIQGVYRELGRRLGELFKLFARALIIVTALFVSIVGIPWAVKLVIQYHLAVPAAALEQLQGRDAVRRGSDLIRGRILHTAAVVTLLNALVALVAVVVGLLLLLILSGAPLWLFSALVTASSALTMPYVGIALTLLYGDARAELDGADRAEPLELETV